MPPYITRVNKDGLRKPIEGNGELYIANLLCELGIRYTYEEHHIHIPEADVSCIPDFRLESGDFIEVTQAGGTRCKKRGKSSSIRRKHGYIRRIHQHAGWPVVFIHAGNMPQTPRELKRLIAETHGIAAAAHIEFIAQGGAT